MNKNYLYIVVFIWVNFAFSSNFKTNDTLIKPKVLIDSMFFSENLNWSVRLLSNFKQQQFRIKDENERLDYKPNNPYGIGVGIANQRLVIDIVFNLKGIEKKEEQTKKFAAEGAFIFKRNLFSFALENVHGYNVSNNENDAEIFRDDISIFSFGLSYLHMLGKKQFSVREMKSGINGTDKTSITFGLGGFLILNSINADGSIIPPEVVPYFNDKAQIRKLNAYGAGVLGGVASYFELPAHFFASLYVAPGIGLEYKDVKTVDDSYTPSNPLIYKTDFFASLGYNQKKFYINFTFSTNLYNTSLDFDNTAFLSVTKSKLIFGYNIGKINFPRKIF